VIFFTFLLYIFVGSFFSATSKTVDTQEYKSDLKKAQTFVVTASENMNDSNVFSYNISQAQNILDEIQKQDLFRQDIQNIRSDISLLQKEQNGIQVFSFSDKENLYFSEEKISPIALVNLESKKYIVTQDSVIGPIF